MSELLLKDQVLNELYVIQDRPVSTAMKIIRELPTIDLVRCEECKYGTKVVTTNKITCELDRQVWEKTDFCSYAERKTQK